ncbi:MAG: hypothetical protein HOF70_19020 [Rhodospirillaceae bacterium]|mgnify:FL=1|jgi:hypothetical protein|nr:hypothetical protein [Rhodospirillaceae bacterium]MBT4118463.1 hypothetical protein [Rhodospirillaceae bacterium]MBT6290197.1 hypothetical protein [Rhodospirillaceae bacterium]MBT6858522.1 hypothetical protein [Rhodospirillaceae bacterium]MBT7570444.1 hypothetical protein [Rhodospirillaceae bacterium]
MMKISHGFIMVAILLLAGCNLAEKYYGSGPLELSPRARAMYNQYLTRGEPIAFAVTLDGKIGYYRYCEDVQCLPDNGARNAVDGCEEAYGQPCKLYANGKNVVWRFSGASAK